MAARRPSVLPMDLSSLLDSFTPEARPVRRASVMLTEQICHSINTLAPAVSVEQRGLIDQISTQGKAGSAAEAERIYHQLAVEQPKLTASPSILNAALDCHAKCQDGSARAAIRLFDTAVDAGQAVRFPQIVALNANSARPITLPESSRATNLSSLTSALAWRVLACAWPASFRIDVTAYRTHCSMTS